MNWKQRLTRLEEAMKPPEEHRAPTIYDSQQGEPPEVDHPHQTIVYLPAIINEDDHELE